MTCHDARELFSALVDDALSTAERSSLDGHLAGCAECRRELERFRATVALTRSLPPVSAPAGFAERVAAAARPEAPRRGRLRHLFVPWTVKLPLQVAAGLLIAGLAAMLFRALPDQQRAVTTGEAPAARGDAPPASQALPADTESPTARSPVERRERATADAFRDSGVRTPEAPAVGARPEADRPAATPPPPAAGAPEPRAADKAGGEPGVAQPPRAVEPRAARAPAAAIAGGRLAVADVAAADERLTAAASRLGGSVVSRRAEGEDRVVEVLVPRDRYDALARELASLGAWSPGAPPPADAPAVRVTVRLVR